MAPIPVVFDCMIYLQAAAGPAGPASACLQLARDGRVILFLSAAILDEVKDVLNRPRTRRKFLSLTPEAVETFLDNLPGNTSLLADVPHQFNLARDPKDEPYLDLALATQARYLVTRDKDLLDLMKDADFLRQFPDLIILEPTTLLRDIRSLMNIKPGYGTGSP